jgi:hypothetical protein
MRAEEFDQKFDDVEDVTRGSGPRSDPPSWTGAAPGQRRFPVVDDRITRPGSPAARRYTPVHHQGLDR